ncbi:TSUP family transporter [Methyloglobulus sp.]|uniref:TSUP family transporter n=1 Tax=Methyloglobulus sp. TaxID=2518622 RepID=UPI0032B7D731
MSLEIMLIVAFTAVIQSVFGAGVLLIGTPLMLLFGYPFIDVLIVLLPISLAMNIMQMTKYHAHIDLELLRKVMWMTLPPIAVFLFLVTHVRMNIGLIIGPFLLFIAFKSISVAVERILDRLMRYEKLYLLTVGIVHGTSNLGGSLLTALIHHKHYPKDVARVTIAACYCSFAVVQLLTLGIFSRQQIDMPVFGNIIYILVATVIFELIDSTFFSRIEHDRYRYIFSGFLAFSGLVLIAKSFLQ